MLIIDVACDCILNTDISQIHIQSFHVMIICSSLHENSIC